MTTDYSVQIKAVKPLKVVTIARFADLNNARECAAGLSKLGFQPIVTYKITHENGDYWL